MTLLLIQTIPQNHGSDILLLRMPNKLTLLAISGSTRQSSSNLNLIHAIIDLAQATFTTKIFDGIADIPHFNPDLDKDIAPEQVTRFRQELSNADAILICTPEYAAGVPGALKNAIDWTVSSMGFSQKPVALITASTSGGLAHQSLLGTLLIIESKITVETQLVISSIKTKVTTDNKITDPVTLEKVKTLIQSLSSIIKSDVDHTFLPPPTLLMS